jgi:hypothetical protein
VSKEDNLWEKKMKKMMEENQEFKKVERKTARVAGKLLGVTPDMENACHLLKNICKFRENNLHFLKKTLLYCN